MKTFFFQDNLVSYQVYLLLLGSPLKKLFPRNGSDMAWDLLIEDCTQWAHDNHEEEEFTTLESATIELCDRLYTDFGISETDIRKVLHQDESIY